MNSTCNDAFQILVLMEDLQLCYAIVTGDNKGEIACNEQFLPFSHSIFYPF